MRKVYYTFKNGALSSIHFLMCSLLFINDRVFSLFLLTKSPRFLRTCTRKTQQEVLRNNLYFCFLTSFIYIVIHIYTHIYICMYHKPEHKGMKKGTWYSISTKLEKNLLH